MHLLQNTRAAQSYKQVTAPESTHTTAPKTPQQWGRGRAPLDVDGTHTPATKHLTTPHHLTASRPQPSPAIPSQSTTTAATPALTTNKNKSKSNGPPGVGCCSASHAAVGQGQALVAVLQTGGRAALGTGGPGRGRPEAEHRLNTSTAWQQTSNRTALRGRKKAQPPHWGHTHRHTEARSYTARRLQRRPPPILEQLRCRMNPRSCVEHVLRVKRNVACVRAKHGLARKMRHASQVPQLASALHAYILLRKGGAGRCILELHIPTCA